jgi:hypothetical protein
VHAEGDQQELDQLHVTPVVVNPHHCSQFRRLRAPA